MYCDEYLITSNILLNVDMYNDSSLKIVEK